MFIKYFNLIFESLRKSYRDVVTAVAICLVVIFVLRQLGKEEEIREEYNKKLAECQDLVSDRNNKLDEIREEFMRIILSQNQQLQKRVSENDSTIRQKIK